MNQESQVQIKEPFKVNPEQPENGEDFAAMLESHGAPGVRLHPGEKVRGTIIAMTDEMVFVDVGVKVDGIIERKDLVDASGEVKAVVGDEVEAWVIAANAHEIKLSRSMSGSGVAALEEAMNAGVPVQGKVNAACKGGYTIEVLGKSAFCPGSQMEPGDAESLVGRSMEFLVTRVESRGRNVVVSRRALIDRERKANLDKVMETLKEGDIVEGRVTRLAPFGAFVELAPSVEGMIHISELSWHRVATPEEAVSSEDVIRAKILSITTDSNGRPRISLSRKQASEDPWVTVANTFKVDQTVPGKVVRLAPFGAFVELVPGVDGLLPLAEMSWTKRIHKPEEAVSLGETVQVRIRDISLEKHRISLSLKDASADPWAGALDSLTAGAEVEGTIESRTQHGIFVNLLPGVTGLLPATVISASSKAAAIKKLNPGDKIQVVVQSADAGARRISLALEDTPVKNDTSWKSHAKSAPQSESAGLSTLGQALRQAMNKNK